ncbi:MAG: FCD domain-containing protein [Anaerolineae bacterium]|nr:FCD domain-containing protein [Anaerolineae bacterium]NUQ02723.1 FadR family transcriptional regulator [Anaerolineae bacterium]
MSRIQLESDLLNFIIRAGFQPGDRLPTLNVLQDENHLDVGISKVREQLEVARALGLVEVRSKTGMRLKEYSFTPAVRLSLFYALAQSQRNFEHFGELRNHLEVAFWNEACARLQPEDLETMRDCIVRAADKLNSSHINIPNEEHRTFHLTLFARLENPFVMGILEAYWDAYEAIEVTRYASYQYLQQVWKYHEQILEALIAGDYEKAKQLFIEHTKLMRYGSDGNR